MSVSALRPRLRSKSGCVTCRSRRKKCDETRPTCQACVRNRLSCSWNGPVHASSQTEVTVVGQNDNGINSTVSHRLSLRVADFVLENRQDDTKIPNLTEFLRRVAADVVREDGWATVPTEHVAFAVVRERLDAIRDYPQAKEMARMDLHLEACGHGQAARTAFCWLFCAMQAFLKDQLSNQRSSSIQLPHWYRPWSDQTTTNALTSATSYINFIPWPSVRRRLLSQPFTYLNERFVQDLYSRGIRFIWPCAYSQVVAPERSAGLFRFSDEFRMRVTNVRSFSLTKDFLDAYPAFRGDAPQLEPSATMCQLTDANLAETLYWTKLRNMKRTRSEKEKSTLKRRE